MHFCAIGKNILSLNIGRKKMNKLYKTKAVVLLNISTSLFMIKLYGYNTNNLVAYGISARTWYSYINVTFFCKTSHHNGYLPQISVHIIWTEIKCKMNSRITFHQRAFKKRRQFIMYFLRGMREIRDQTASPNFFPKLIVFVSVTPKLRVASVLGIIT